MNNIIVDTGFWFGLYTQSDPHHERAEEIMVFLQHKYNDMCFIIPYPTLYETLNTKFLRTKNRRGSEEFIKRLNSDQSYQRVDDSKYREPSFTKTISHNERGLSFVDNCIREMIEDRHQNIDALLSFNTCDFIDVCNKYGIALIDDNYPINNDL